MVGEESSQPPQLPIASQKRFRWSHLVVYMTKDEADREIEVPPVTVQQILARTRARKAKSTLLMAIPDEHLARFHGIKDAKTLWAAIKTRFGGNAESKKMQKNVLKQQFKIFSVSNSEGLDKRNKPGIDNLDIDDLYNNLKVYEADIKGSSGSSSNSQNMDSVSAESNDSTNKLNVPYSVSTATGQSSQVAILSMRVEKFYKKTKRKLEFNRKEPVGFNKNKDTNEEIIVKGLQKRRMNKHCQISAKVKTSLGYDSHLNAKKVLDIKEKEVTETVFDNCLSDEENSIANDRFKKGEGYHAVPPPLTRNYMPPKPDLLFAGLEDSIYKFKISETATSLAKDKKDAPETSTACVEKPKKDRSSAPLIED
uniref:Xylulose kinase-1 n=1 Tax=Tanacetum cinerariifolium TaxID=118510 RepID=A0A6L2KNG6_TANCI|nr:xylulose kinase-1 [Tanacetum cinerariifolium]